MVPKAHSNVNTNYTKKKMKGGINSYPKHVRFAVILLMCCYARVIGLCLFIFFHYQRYLKMFLITVFTINV